jgi:putative transposase
MLERISDWDAYLADAPQKSIIESIRSNTMSGRPAGTDEFVGKIEKRTGLRLRKRKPGPVPERFRN